MQTSLFRCQGYMCVGALWRLCLNLQPWDYDAYCCWAGLRGILMENRVMAQQKIFTVMIHSYCSCHNLPNLICHLKIISSLK